MKALLGAMVIVGVLAQDAPCACSYFRTKLKLLSCESVDPKSEKFKETYPSPEDLPDLEESASQNLIQIRCHCEYSLSGSDPRCDVDQTFEKSSVVGAESASRPCRRASTLCRDLCPSQLR